MVITPTRIYGFIDYFPGVKNHQKTLLIGYFTPFTTSFWAHLVAWKRYDGWKIWSSKKVPIPQIHPETVGKNKHLTPWKPFNKYLLEKMWVAKLLIFSLVKISETRFLSALGFRCSCFFVFKGRFSSESRYVKKSVQIGVFLVNYFTHKRKIPLKTWFRCEDNHVLQKTDW